MINQERIEELEIMAQQIANRYGSDLGKRYKFFGEDDLVIVLNSRDKSTKVAFNNNPVFTHYGNDTNHGLLYSPGDWEKIIDDIYLRAYFRKVKFL